MNRERLGDGPEKSPFDLDKWSLVIFLMQYT